MTSIKVKDVTVEFTIFDANGRSFRHALLRGGNAGILQKTAKDRLVVTALNNVSFEAEHGDRIGLIGANGAGKTTLLRVVAGVYPPLRGEVRVDGDISPMFNISLGMQMDATGYENIRICGMMWGMTREEVAGRAEEIAAFSELGDYLNVPIRTYSAGMMARLAFAIATARDPDVLLLDEGIGAGDSRFLKKALARTRELMEHSSILMIASHSESIIRGYCNKVIWLHNGVMLEYGSDVEYILGGYQRSQTQSGLAAPQPEAKIAG